MEASIAHGLPTLGSACLCWAASLVNSAPTLASWECPTECRAVSPSALLLATRFCQGLQFLSLSLGEAEWPGRLGVHPPLLPSFYCQTHLQALPSVPAGGSITRAEQSLPEPLLALLSVLVPGPFGLGPLRTELPVWVPRVKRTNVSFSF